MQGDVKNNNGFGKQDMLDKSFQLKKFLKTLFNNKSDEEYICVFQLKHYKDGNEDKVSRQNYWFNDIDDIVEFVINNNIKGVKLDTYFSLGTFPKECTKEEDMLNRYCLAYDIDWHDENASITSVKGVFDKLQSVDNKLFAHAVVDTGHGVHIYFFIDKTNDFDCIRRVNSVLCRQLGADTQAKSVNQSLRMPFTYNVGRGDVKYVNLVYCQHKTESKFKTFSISQWERWYPQSRRQIEKRDLTNNMFTFTEELPPCIRGSIINGTDKGSRNEFLRSAVVILRDNFGYSKNEIVLALSNWAVKSKFTELEYQVSYCYKNCTTPVMCASCKYRGSCYKSEQPVEAESDSTPIQVSETIMNKLRVNKRKGAKVMDTNELIIYLTLKKVGISVSVEDITRVLTVTNVDDGSVRIAMNDRLLKATLKSLVTKEFITEEVVNKKKMYTVKPVRTKASLLYTIDFKTVNMFITGLISKEELKLYIYLVNEYHKLHNEDSEKYPLDSRWIRINQEEIGNDIGVTFQRVSAMVSNLVDKNMMLKQISKATEGYSYNSYKLLY